MFKLLNVNNPIVALEGEKYFKGKATDGKGAQAEIAELAEQLRQEIVKVEKWVDEFFGSGK